MALVKEKVSIPFATGIDTKTDPKQLTGKLLELENGRFVQAGKIQKRFGTNSFTTDIDGGGSLSNITKIIDRDGEMVCLADRKLYSYSDNKAAWVEIEGEISGQVEQRTVYSSDFSEVSVAYVGDYELILNAVPSDTATDADPSYTIVDRSTGTILKRNIKYGSGSDVRCAQAFATDDKFVITYMRETDFIYFRSIPISTLALGSETTIATNVNTTSGILEEYDVSQLGDDIFITYINTSQEIQVYKFDMDAETSSNYTISSNGGIRYGGAIHLGTSIDSEDRLWITFIDDDVTDNYAVVVLDDTLSEVVAPTISTLPVGTTLDPRQICNTVITDGSTSGTLYVYYVSDDLETNPLDSWSAQTTLTTVAFDEPLSTISTTWTSPTLVASQGGLFHKPYNDGTYRYEPLAYYNRERDADLGGYDSGSTANSFFYLRRSDGIILAQFLRFVASKNEAQYFTKNSTTYDNKRIFSVIKNTNVAEILRASTIVEIDLTNTPDIIEFEDRILISGSVVKEYDGANFRENNFLRAPQIQDVSDTVNGSGFAAGDYTFKAMYLRFDRFGNQIRSDLSQTRTLTIGAASDFSFEIEALTQTDDSTYRETFIVVYISNGTTDYSYTVFSDATNNLVTISNLIPSTNGVIDNDLPYTSGGELANFTPENAEYFVKSKSRVFFNSKTEPNTVYYSKLIGETNVVEFNPNLLFDVIGQGATITALGELDDKIVIFKETGIFIVAGAGPDNTGSSTTGQFTEPTLVSSDTGCIDPKSVVLTANGLMFKSRKGIQLLTRQLQVFYIGAEVEDYNDETINAAIMMDDYNEVRFFTDSRCLVYNYYFQQWSTFTYSGTAAYIFDNVLYFATASAISNENSSSFTDAGAHVALSLTTQWFYLNGLQNLQRIYNMKFLGDYLSAHSFKLSVAYDFESSFTQFVTIDSESEYTTSDVYQFEINFKRQKCETFKLKIEDIQSSGFGEGLSLSNMLLTYGRKRRGQTFENARTFGTE